MASEIYFTTNPADIAKLEGMYVVEQDPPGFIQGVDLSGTAIAGKCVRGPVDKWVSITSPARFQEVFGGRDYIDGSTRVGEIWWALQNVRFGALKVRRVAAAAATKGTKTLANVTPTTIATATASSAGAWSNSGNGLTLDIENATNGDATMWNLRVTYRGLVTLYENLNTQSGYDNLAETVGDDDGRLIDLAKNANGRPLNAAAIVLSTVVGSDGAIADTDYATAIAEMPAVEGVGCCLVPDVAVTAMSAFNTAIMTAAATCSDRVFVTWSGVHGESVATDVTAIGTQITTRLDRVIWCFNSCKIVDPVTGIKVARPPHVQMASILSQIDVGTHPGEESTKALNAGVSELYNEILTRADLVSLKAAGVSTLEKVKGGFKFRSGVVTDLTPGKTEITRRRIADFLQNSASNRLVNFVKKKGTRARRNSMVAEIVDFSKSYTEDEAGDAALINAFQVLNDEVNTSTNRGQGRENILWKVDIIDHMLEIVLATEIGTGVTIAQ